MINLFHWNFHWNFTIYWTPACYCYGSYTPVILYNHEQFQQEDKNPWSLDVVIEKGSDKLFSNSSQDWKTMFQRTPSWCIWGTNCSLKMICNDFLVVKVNYWSYVFNIIKSILNIEDHQKIRKLYKKAFESAHRWFVYFSQVMTSYQKNKTKQPIEFWMLTTDRAITHRHNDKGRNRFLKHKQLK